MKTDKLYFGAAYYDEYMPVSRVDEDMRMMKEAGMNVIRIAESTWSTWEPRDGEYDFTSLHRMLRGAKKYGINVIVGTPTYAIPPWLARKYPDILADTHSGLSKYGHRQNMDITHPGYRFHCERIIRRLMEEVQQYDHVIGFQLDNETKPYDTCGPRAQALFKQWLMDKFQTVEALNQAFGLAYWSNSLGSWDDLPDVRGTINNSLAAEFEAFQRNLVTEFLLWQRSIVDEYRRPEQFVTHNFDYEWRDYSHALQPDADQFKAAEAVTVAGCDIYHPTASFLTGAEISFGGDLARGLKHGENFFVLETQAQGPVGRLPWPGQLRLQAFAHLANGANMVEYWHWHSIHNAIECHWKGVLSHDFTPGAVYQEAKTIGADFARIGSHVVNLKRSSDVAFLVSNRSLTGLKHSYAFAGPNYGDILRWLYDSFFRLNISVDILDDSTRDFSGYKLVVTPGLYCAEDSLIEALRDYVRGGGHAKIKGKTVFRAIYFLPMVVAPAAVAMVWKWIFNTEYGIINTLFGANVRWLTDPNVVMITCAIVAIWSAIGYDAVLLLSGIQNISKSLYEAAGLDGASKVRQFFTITLPMVSPTLFVVLIMRLMASLKVYDLIYMMVEQTNPALTSAQSLMYLFYRESFIAGNKGYASAIVIWTVLLIGLVTIVQFIGQKKWVNYEV